MKPISPKTLLSLSSSSSSPYRIFIARFSTYSNSSPRRHEEESRNVRVSVWWDFENCNLPACVNVYKVAHTITAAIRASGIKGPVTITAFGDVLQMSRPNQEALSSTGINISHVPRGGKNTADRSLLVDLMYWVSHNPPPAHLFLISSDRDFASVLHRLRMNNYNILLASRERVSNVLCSAASIMWNWDSLVRGETLVGSHFNQPPDGPYGSWYGHYKGPLVDPLAVAEQSASSPASSPASSHTDETPEPASDSKQQPIPKPVIREISHILNSYPSGVPITELRFELSKSLTTIDKNLYGYKKFSRFLLSMPDILKLQPEADGQFLVFGVTPKAPEPFETSLGTSNGHVSKNSTSNGHVCTNGDQEPLKSMKLNGVERLENGAAKGKSVSPSFPDAVLGQPSEKVQIPLSSEKVVHKQEAPEKVQQIPPIDKNVIAPAAKGKSVLSSFPDAVLDQPSEKVQQIPSSSEKIVNKPVLEAPEKVQQIPPIDKNAIAPAAKGKSVLPSFPDAVLDQPSEKVQQIPSSSEKVVNKQVLEAPEKVQQIPPIDKNVIAPVGMQEDDGHLQDALKQDSVSEVGFFKKIWLRWFGGKEGKSEIKSLHIPDKKSDSGDIPEKISQKLPEKPLACGDDEKKKRDDKYVKSPAQDSDSAETVQEKKPATSSQACADKSTTSPGVLSRMANWSKSGRSDPDSDTVSDQSSEACNQINRSAQKHGIFLKNSFWLDMESFMDSPRGSFTVSHSSSRKQMAQFLKEEGPLVLRDLSDCDLLDLVDLLISEKKWVEEYPSEKSPFKLSGLVIKKSSLGHSHAANGLRSLFLNEPSQSDRLKVQHLEEEKKALNIPHAGVSASGINKQSSFRSRNDILIDCEKLVDEILKEYPEGYKLASFRKLFIERYGYNLDLQKLGYQKLETLLQIMPSVKVESSYIRPSNKVPDSSDSELLETSKKNDDSDSQWEELGPVSNSSFDGKDVQSGLKGGAMKEIKRETCPDYEPPVSDDEFSDSEGNTSAATQPEGQGKRGVNDEDSSLLQILDSWYSSKEEVDNKKNKSENADGLVDCSTESIIKPSVSSEAAAAATKNETSSGNVELKQRPQRNYSFTTDHHVNEEEKLVEEILGNLKKSGESRMQG